MRRAPSILLALLCSVFAGGDYARSASVAETDHLIPVGEIISADYYALLQRKLFVSPADFARVVDLPPGGQEVVVAIYTAHSGSNESAKITYTRCDQLWDVGRDGQGNVTKEPTVSVKRLDAPFPKELALTVNRAFRRALAERLPRPAPRDTDVVTVDGSLVEFSVSGGQRHTPRGLLTPDARGKNAQRLHHLKDLLERYCQTRAADRTSVARQIAIAAAKTAREPVRTNGLTPR